ncbi:MAG: cbb3-type cytochrome c oxidase subunit 3 [Bacteroidia bacterium]|nr:cbb3-type cytochrome c oxidase subunit 3 [Bacteroidia bacterium]
MYKEILQTIDNVQIWPIISFCIFFTFFLILSWWALTADKKYINDMRQMPLRDDDSEITNSNL